MEHFYGHRDRSRGVLPDCLPPGNRGDHDRLAGLGVNFRRSRPVCVRTLFADYWKLFLEGSFEPTLRSLRYRVGVFPIAGVAALTGVLGTLLLIQAGLLATSAFQLRPVEGWGWFLFDAASNLFLGILILAKWPSSSVWAIGTLVGVSVVMSGVSRIMIATKIRSGAANVERFVRAA